jgi:hypothetical protein
MDKRSAPTPLRRHSPRRRSRRDLHRLPLSLERGYRRDRTPTSTSRSHRLLGPHVMATTPTIRSTPATTRGCRCARRIYRSVRSR